MVARPSLKRVVPGSVPPWRALCAESARSESFSVLCVSREFPARIQVRADFARVSLSAFGLGARAGAWAAGAAGPRRSFSGLAVVRLSRSGWPRPRRSFGLPQRCLWPRRGFPFRQSRKRGSLSSSVRLIALSEHFHGQNALGFARRRTSKLVGVLRLS